MSVDVKVEPDRREQPRRFRRAVIATVGARGISAISLLAVTPLLVAELGVESYGVLVTLTTTATVLRVADLGIGNEIISRIATAGWESPRTQVILSAAGFCVMTASAVATALSMFLTWVLPWPTWLNAPSISHGELRWSTMFALLGVSLSLTTGLGQKIDLARQRADLAAIWTGCAAVAGPASGTVVAILTGELVAVMAAVSLIPPVVLAIQGSVAVRRLPTHLRPRLTLATWPEIRESLRGGSAFFGLGVVMALSFQLDTLIVSGVLGASAAAQYGVVIRMFTMFGTTIQASLSQLWAAFAEAVQKGDVEWIRRSLRRATVGAALAMLAVSAVLVPLGERLVRFWLGGAQTPGVLLLASAAVWFTYSAAVHPLSMFLNGAQMQVLQLKAAVPMAIVNLTLSLLLAVHLGSPGPLIGSFIAHVTCVLLPMSLATRNRLRTLQSRTA